MKRHHILLESGYAISEDITIILNEKLYCIHTARDAEAKSVPWWQEHALKQCVENKDEDPNILSLMAPTYL